MKNIVSLTDAIPSEIAILTALLESSTGKTPKQVLSMISSHLNGTISSLVNSALSELGLTTQDLNDAKKYWDKFNQSIGQIDEEQSWDIDWDASNTLGNSVPISLNVSAIASTAFRVLNKEKALKKHKLSLQNGDVLVNHEVKAGGSIGGSANATVGYVGIEVGGQYTGEIEIDTFLQYPSATSNLDIISDYFLTPLKIWNFDDINRQLNAIDVNNQTHGLRKISINTEGSFKFNGKLSVGRAWSFAGDGSAKELSGEVNANIGFSKGYEHNGKLRLEFEKIKSSVDGIPVLNATVYLEESSKDSSSFNLDVNANIKGLDLLAGKYVNGFLKKGDELTSLLEEWSRPAGKIIGEASSNLSETKWYNPIAKLLLGTMTADDAAKKLIDDEVSEILDRYLQSPDYDSENIARKAIDRLLDVFSTNGSSELVGTAQKELAKKIESWKKDLSKEINRHVAKYQGKAKSEFLQPLESLGADVQALVVETDKKVSESIKKALTEYQSLKERMTKALEKSANIKLGLAIAYSRSSGSIDEQWIKIEFLDTSSATVKEFYKKLVLGDSSSASKILASLEQKKLVRVINQAVSLGWTNSSTTSFTVSLGNFQLSKVKNANSELKIKVTNTGEIAISSKVEASASSSGRGEVRSASAKLVYGLAQQAISPDKTGNMSISYSNVDNRLFKNKEMKGMLNSLDFSNNKRVEETGLNLPKLIEESKIPEHLRWYKEARNWKHADVSSVDITVPMEGGLYESMLSLDPEKAYRIACSYWYGLFVSRKNKGIISTIMSAYVDTTDVKSHLDLILQDMEDNTSFDWKGIKRIAKNSDEYKANELNILREKNWKESARLLSKIYQAGNSMREIINSIKGIEGVVASTMSSSNDVRANAEKLCKQLHPLNRKIEHSLSLWVDVEGVVDDLFSQEINETLLCFYLILAQLTGKERGFVRTLITVSGGLEYRMIRLVV